MVRGFVRLILVSPVVWLLTADCWGYAFAGGTGVPNDPYRIATAAQLVSMGSDPNLLDSHFVLVADLDLKGMTFTHAVIAPNLDASVSWLFVEGTSFTGCFDGCGHTIRNLTIRGGSYLGLFGAVGFSYTRPQVRNLGMVDVDISGTGGDVGGLVGGSVGAAVTNCFSTGTVEGGNRVGGLVGSNMGEEISNCYSTAAVAGDNDVGGLVGWNGDGAVSNCYSTGKVTGVTVGGLVGPGLHTFGAGEVCNSFWDKQTSACPSSLRGTGLMTVQMKDVETYRNAGWDLAGESNNGTSEFWQMPQGGGYPVLSVFNGYHPIQLQGCGTADDPYLVSKAADLGAVVWHGPWACYRLTTDVDLSGQTWSDAVIPLFCGVFDGNGHTIRNLTIRGGGFLGLFGVLAGGEVKDLGVAEVGITGEGYLAAVVGLNLGGTVSGSYSTGKVTGTGTGTGWFPTAGGLVAANSHMQYGRHGKESNCYSTAAVTTTGKSNTAFLGGLVGRNADLYGDYGTVSNCYSTGSVINTASAADVHIGGLVGDGNNLDTDSSFWDKQTSACISSGGGKGLTSAQMKDINTYLAAGWDFVGEVTNAFLGIWKMPTGGGYPVLSAFSGHVPPDFVDDFEAYDNVCNRIFFAWVDGLGYDTSAGCGVPANSGNGTGSELGNMEPEQFIAHSGEQSAPFFYDNSTGRLYSEIQRTFDAPKDWTSSNAHALVLWLYGDPNNTLVSTDKLYIGIEDKAGKRAFVEYSGPAHDLQVASWQQWQIRLRALTGIDLRQVWKIYLGIGNRDKPHLGGWGKLLIDDIYLLPPYSAGRGTADDPYQIATLQNLTDLGQSPQDYGKSFILTADVNMAGPALTDALIAPWTSLASAAFAGTFDGNDHTISNLTIVAAGKNGVGLFGCTDANAVIERLALENCRITGHEFVGGLIGRNRGDIKVCSTAGGRVGGGLEVGGLVGLSEVGSIEDCYARTDVNATGRVAGGLVGRNQGTIMHTYSTGVVTCPSYAGGLVGDNTGGTVTNSLWDTQTSKLSQSAGGTGQTTAQMQTKSTYGGWDFVNVWSKVQGDYPIFLWQKPSGPPPIAHWTFDEGSGTVAHDAVDGNDAKIMNGATWTAGKIGNALSFDGVNDYVDCGGSTALSPLNLTVALWVRPEGAGNCTIVRKGATGSDSEYQLTLSSNGCVAGSFKSGSQIVKVVSPNALPANRWAHVAFTRDGHEAALYVNGADKTVVAYNWTPVSGSGPLCIGGGGANQPYKGCVDDVRIYDQALSAEEIKDLYEEASN